MFIFGSLITPPPPPETGLQFNSPQDFRWYLSDMIHHSYRIYTPLKPEKPFVDVFKYTSLKMSSNNFLRKGCGYSSGTGTQVRVPALYIYMGSSHACAVVLVVISRE